MEIEVDFFLNL